MLNSNYCQWIQVIVLTVSCDKQTKKLQSNRKIYLAQSSIQYRLRNLAQPVVPPSGLKLALLRLHETQQQTADRLKKIRAKIENETPQQTADRLKKQREADRARTQNETPQQRRVRLERDKLRHKSRLLMDPLKLQAIRKKIRLSKRSPTKKQR